MKGFTIFQCTGYEDAAIPDEVLEQFNEPYERFMDDPLKLAQLAKAIRIHSGKPYAELPLGHTIEAESFGAVVVFDALNGNRIPVPLITSLEGWRELQAMDITSGPMATVLETVRMLKAEGENVVMNVSGPVSLGISLLDAQTFFKAARKTTADFQSFLAMLTENITEFALAGAKAGADIISIADPAGNMDILGPRIYGETAGKAMYRILEELARADVLVHLCGRTSTSMSAADLMRTEVMVAEGANYFEALKHSRQAGLQIAGHRCIKSGRNDGKVIKCILK